MNIMMSRQEAAQMGLSPISGRQVSPGREAVEGLRIRSLARHDAERVFRFNFDLYQERKRFNNFFHARTEPTPTSSAELVDGLVERIGARQAVAVVAAAERRMVGLAFAERLRVGGYHDPFISFYVAEGFRGRRVGSAMMDELIQRSKGVFDVLMLSVRAENARAREFYSKFGFKEAGSSPSGKHIRMALRLMLRLEPEEIRQRQCGPL
jgi:ribosomal protein S18 acetylase RimI-like enzyme